MNKNLKDIVTQFFHNHYELAEDHMFVSFKISMFVIKDFKCIQIGYLLNLFEALKSNSLESNFNYSASLIEFIGNDEVKILLAKSTTEKLL